MPAAALPLGEVELIGANLGPDRYGPPVSSLGTHPAQVLMSRPGRLAFRVPENAGSRARLKCERPPESATLHRMRIARELSGGLHPVTSPAVSRSGMIYATISGQRGKQTPVSVVRVSPDGRGTPFVTGILNATGLAFSPEGDLVRDLARRRQCLSHRSAPASPPSTPRAWASPPARPSMRMATCLSAIAAARFSRSIRSVKIFVHATLEPSVSAYHLAMDTEGTLFVTGPSLSSNEAIWAIEPHGEARAWFRGLGRPQGLALSKEGDVYVAACLRAVAAWCALRRMAMPPSSLAGINLVGIAFSPLGTTDPGRPTKPFMMWTWVWKE